MKKYIALFKSFGYAFSGLFFTIKHERNMRIHLTCMTYMFAFLLFTPWFEVSVTQFAILLLTSALVLSLEVVNTAIENAVNLSTKDFDPYAKIAKDAAAAAVLVAAIFAVLIGITILFQPTAFAQMFEYFTNNLLALALFVLSLIPGTIFIFFGFNIKGKHNDE